MFEKTVCAALTISAALLLGACSGVDEKRQLYKQADSIAPLNIPAGLNRPEGARPLSMPEVDRSALSVEAFDTHPPSNLPVELEEESAAESSE